MPDPFVIVRAEAIDCGEMAAKMRDGDRRECLAAGMSPKRAVWRSYRSSLLTFSALVDGELAAIFGMGGDMVTDVGEPWLFTTPLVEVSPKWFVRHARALVARMLESKPKLEGYVFADYRQACGLLERIGFTLDPPIPYGRNGTPFRRFSTMRR